MKDIEVRGYIISSTVAYIRETAGEKEGTRILGSLSPELKAVIETVKPANWYPVAHIAELNRVIVKSLGGDDEDRARDALIKCGKFMSHEATNTFLRLLMRMLTPTLFAKKLPDFWKRDCSGGRLEVDVTNRRLVCRIFDVGGYDHLGPVATGYASFALEAMGKVLEETKLHDWSPSKPYVDGVWFEITWKE